ncbi:MAG: crotonase/enoyl-CoA hydratase family protein [Myxococcaceae bacterium]|nr:crotonase/enoyl-CoA hydratase family protein [Myxococcaceae bacterium]
MSALVSYRLEGPIATLTLDDGKRNALSLAMLSELDAALDRAAADDALVILTGREGVLSAGFDLGVLKKGGADAFQMLHAGFALPEKILSHRRPVIVACTGHAIAMGVFIVLSADYRIGVAGPYKYAANEVAIGLTMPRVAIEVCRQRLTPAHFNRAVLLAEVYDPEGAREAGFLDRVVPAGELLDSAHELAAELLKLDAKAHAASKLRMRAELLAAIRAGSALDDEDYRRMT